MYVVSYGMCLYFKQLVKDKILKSPFIVALFDENISNL